MFTWNHQPTFTLSGLIRLTVHVLNAFLKQQEKCDHEEYDNWRDELPGIVVAQMAPQYWVWKSDGLLPAHAAKKMSGFYDYIATHIKESDFKLLALRELLEKIETIFNDCSKQEKLSFFSLYATYSLMVVPEGKPTTSRKFIDKHLQSMTQECSIQMMAAFIVLKNPFPWNAAVCSEQFEIYHRRKYKPNAINLPIQLEIALRLEVAAKHHEESAQEQFEYWSRMSALESAGDSALQKKIYDSIRNNSPILGYDILCGLTDNKSKKRCIHPWDFEARLESIRSGDGIRFEFDQPFMLRWTTDSWKTHEDTYAAIAKESTCYSTEIYVDGVDCYELEFTVYWIGSQRWEGENFKLPVKSDSSELNC